VVAELSAWREALTLLPPGSRQHEAVAEKVGELSRKLPAETLTPRPSWAQRAGPIGAAGLLVWKFKFALGSIASMLLSLGVYWTAWGWRFALGLVASIFVHEMGHVVALRRLGIPARAPMFVPGVGAFVKHAPIGRPADEARVALAGPLWGLGATLAAAAVHFTTGSPIWAGLAQWSARINLFNLTPVPPLDGATAFRVMSRGQRWLLVLMIGAVRYHTGENLLWLVLLLAVVQALGPAASADADWTTVAGFGFLLVALVGLTRIPVPLEAQP
jgi:Zn-dependent protease